MLDRIRAWLRRTPDTSVPRPPEQGPTPGTALGATPSAGDRDTSAEDTDAPPVPARHTGSGAEPTHGLQVAADGAYDRGELERFVVSRLPQVDPLTVRDVLDVYDEHLAVRGITDVPSEGLRFYDPSEVDPGADPVIDAAEVAADAVRFLDVDAATAERILDVEHDYLDAKGLLG